MLTQKETGLKIMGKPNNKSNNFHHKLSILSSQGGFSFLIQSEDELIRLEHVESRSQSPEDQLDQLKKTIDEDFIINNHIDQVKLIFDNKLFTNVPDIYFDNTQAAHYLKYNTELIPGDYIDHDHVKPFQMKVLYIPIMNIYNYFIDLVGNVSYQHFLSAYLSAVDVPADVKESVFIHRYFDNCYILAFYKGKCMLANRFQIETDEDIAYYLLSCIEQLSFNRETLHLKVSGFINKTDKAYSYFYDYIKNITFYKPVTSEKQFLSEITSHQDTSLLCHYQ